MNDAAKLIEQASEALKLPPDEVIESGVHELRRRIRRSQSEMRAIRKRYGVKDSGQLLKLITDGEVEEHPAWEDLIRLENTEKWTRSLQLLLGGDKRCQGS